MARSRILYFDLLLFLFAAFVLLEEWLFHVLFLFFLLLPMALLLYVLLLRYCVFLRLADAEDLIAKGSYCLRLAAENRSILPCGMVRMQLKTVYRLGQVPDQLRDERSLLQTALPPLCRTDWCSELRIDAAGRMDLTIEQAWVYDPLGLIRLPIAARNRTAAQLQLYVLPEPVRRTMDAEKAADLGRDSDTYSPVKSGGDPAELFRLRDYRPGDARHSIHWKLSGRWDRLIVREFGLPLSPALCFLVSLTAGVSAQDAEEVLATVLSVSEHLLAQSIPHRIGWVGEDSVLNIRDIDTNNDLADALHGLLALPAAKQGTALLQFLTAQPPQPELHLLLLSAGPETRSDAEDRLLLTATEGGFCRRLSILSASMSKQRAAHLRGLGCEAYLLDGRRPDVEEVEA